MKDLLLLGTGVHVGETIEIIERINNIEKSWNLLGLIPSKAENTLTNFNGYPVFKYEDHINKFPNAYIVPVFGWPAKNELPPERLVSIIDPSSFVSRTAQIGKGTIIYPNCFIGLNAKIGSFVFCLSGCIINHDDVIEDFVTLASGVHLAGSVHIGKSTYMGQSSTVKQNVKIGCSSIIGMGSVIVKDVEPRCVMVGNPGRKLRENISQ